MTTKLDEDPETPIITRAEYMRGRPESKEAQTQAHQEFFQQFVTTETLHFVRDAFGIEVLSAGYIPLEQWDAVCTGTTNPDFAAGRGKPLVPLDQQKWKTAHDGKLTFSPSDMICVAKEAARVLVEQHRRH